MDDGGYRVFDVVEGIKGCMDKNKSPPGYEGKCKRSVTRTV
jgi:hypothetical protein